MQWVSSRIRIFVLPRMAATVFGLLGCLFSTPSRAGEYSGLSSTPGLPITIADAPVPSYTGSIAPDQSLQIATIQGVRAENDLVSNLLSEPLPSLAPQFASSHPEPEAVAAPEPTSLSLLAVGLGMIAVARRRRQWFR